MTFLIKIELERIVKKKPKNEGEKKNFQGDQVIYYPEVCLTLSRLGGGV